MSWAIVAVAATTVVAGVASNQANRRATGASNAATRSSLGEQARQYDQTRQDFGHTRGLGISATNTLNRLYGYAQAPTEAQQRAQAPVLIGDQELPAGTTTKAVGGGWYEVWNGGVRIGTLRPGGSNGRYIPDGEPLPAQPQMVSGDGSGTPGTPDMTAFTESPDYQFNLGEGQKALDRSLVARGRALSGAGAREGIRYASGMASGEFNNFTQRLLAMAGLGQAATQSTAVAGMNAANNNSQAMLLNGQQRASGYAQHYQNVNNAAQSGVSNALLLRYLNRTPTGSTPPYNSPESW
jgi:hypothetical protein